DANSSQFVTGSGVPLSKTKRRMIRGSSSRSRAQMRSRCGPRAKYHQLSDSFTPYRSRIRVSAGSGPFALLSTPFIRTPREPRAVDRARTIPGESGAFLQADVLLELLVLLQHLEHGLGDQLIPQGIGVPGVGLHVNLAEAFDGAIHGPAVRLRFDLELPDIGDVEALPFSFFATVGVDVKELRPGRERGRVGPHPVARLLVAVGSVVVHGDLVGRQVPQLRVGAGDVHGFGHR